MEVADECCAGKNESWDFVNGTKDTVHKMTENEDVRDHLTEFFETVDKFRDMNIIIHPDQLAIMELYILPSSFENFNVQFNREMNCRRLKLFVQR